MALGGRQLPRSRLLEIKLADDRILGNGLADQFAESDAAAVADAGDVHLVIVAEEIALNVADGIQTLDDLVVFGKNLGLCVDVQAERDGQQAANVLRGVERSGLDGREEVCRNAEVDILAICGKLVVALNGCLEVVGGNADFLGELFDGVCFDEGAFLLPVAMTSSTPSMKRS